MSAKQQLFGTSLFAALMLLTGALSAQSSLENAKKFYADGKYMECVKALEGELKNGAPEEALKLAMEANAKAGNIVSANVNATELLRKTQNKNFDYIYTAAGIADMAGDTKLAVSRYHTYILNRSTTNDAKLMYALQFVLRNGSYPEIFRIYAEKRGPAATVNGAIDNIQKLLDSQDSAGLAEMIKFCAKTYADYPQVFTEISRKVWNDRNKIQDHAKVLDAVTGIKWHKDCDPGQICEYIMWTYGAAKLPESKVFEYSLNFVKNSGVIPWNENLFVRRGMDYVKSRSTPAAKAASAKEYLSAAEAYEKSTSANPISQYVNTIAANRDAIVGARPEFFARLTKRFNTLVNEHSNEGTGDGLSNSVIYTYYKDNVQSGVMYAKAAMETLGPNTAEWLFRNDPTNSDIKNKVNNNIEKYLSNFKGFERQAVQTGIMQSLRDFGFTQQSLDAIRLSSTTGPFDGNWVASFIGDSRFDAAAALKTASDIYNTIGYNAQIQRMFDTMSKNARFNSLPAFAQFKTSVEQKKAGSDPVLAAAAKFFETDNRMPNRANLERAYADFLNVYKGKIPATRRTVENPQEFAAYRSLERVWSIQENKDSAAKILSLTIPRFKTPGPMMNTMLSKALWIDSTKNGLGYKMLKHAIPIIAAANETNFNGIWEIANRNLAEAGKDFSVMTPLYAASPYLTQQTFAYFRQSAGDWSAPFLMSQIEAVLDNPRTELTGDAFYSLQELLNSSVHKDKVPASLAAKYMKASEKSAAKTGTPDYAREAFPFQLKNADTLQLAKDFSASLGAKDVRSRIVSVTSLFGRVGMKREAGMYIVENVMKPILDGSPDAYAGATLELAFFHFLGGVVNASDAPENMRASAKAMLDKASLLVLEGKIFPPSWNVQDVSDYLVPAPLKQIVDTNDSEKIAAAASVLGGCFEKETNTWRGKNKLAETLKLLEKSPSQIRYALLNSAMRGSGDFAKSVKSDYVMEIARLGKDVPGMMPVDKSDPAYDLFLAAKKRTDGNQFDAWVLIKEKIPVLTARWKEFDLDFVIWALDMARKAKLYKEADTLAQTVWLDEHRLSADAASMLGMIKGDIYRDMKNYPAARIEYESLGNTPRYAKTDGGRMAKFRLIELLILTQDYQSARTQLERLINSRTVADQAEAYYLLAKLDYQQEEYESAKENLQETFNRYSGHIEGNLLWSEIELKLGSITRDTVEIGLIALAEVIVPGRPIYLQIQDNNLSIVRAGRALPVIVKTSNGKDVEKVELLPDSNNTKKFSAQIATTIGKAVPNNGVVELNGSDTVYYEIDPAFQKANNMQLEGHTLTVKSSAKLYAASQKILSEEEQENLAMQETLELTSGLRNRVGSNKTVRPGSPIYLRVIDADMCKNADKPDSVFVDIVCSSGDELKHLELKETGSCTGVFEAVVQTGIPFPNVTVSDSREGVDVNALINENKKGSWISLPADGKDKAKWIKVDTMTSYEFKEVKLSLPNPASLKAFKVYASLDTNENELICEYPQIAASKVRGGLEVAHATGTAFNLTQIMDVFKKANPKSIYARDTVARRELDKNFNKRDANVVVSMTGTFYLQQDEQLELKFIQEAADNQMAYLIIDGRELIGGKMNKAGLMSTRSVYLQKGIHTLAVYGGNFSKNATIQLGMLQADGTYKPLPAEWFSTEKNPELAEFLKPKGTITTDKDSFTIKLNKAARYRTVRFDIEDYTGNQVEISGISARDVKGEKILPVTQDLADGKANDILEIAAADTITVSYEDVLRTTERNAILTEKLSSSFHDAIISMAYEDMVLDADGFPKSVLAPAIRVQKGDSVILNVNDNDMDTDDERQTVKATVETSSGEKLELELLEVGTTNNRGMFRETFKLGDVTDPVKRTLKLNPGDKITATYLDQENNRPGIPFARTATIENTAGSKPKITVYNTAVTMIVDKSEAALAKIRMMRAKGDKRENILIFKENIDATPILPDGETAPDAPLAVNSKAPLLFELEHPEIAKHADSKTSMEVLAQSEIDAAAQEQREPVPLVVEMKLQPLAALARAKGYPVTIKSWRTGGSLTDLGIFTGLVRFQLGAPGDEINDTVTNNDTFNLLSAETAVFGGDANTFKVPTIIVSGSDTLYISFKDKAGHDIAKKTVHLRSDGEIGLYDKRYESENAAIHLGQSFNVRVYDPDRDVTSGRDTVNVNVVSDSGDKMTLKLTETLIHSGVFTGSLKTELKPKKTSPEQPEPVKIQDNVLWANFGSKVDFTYSDDRPLTGTEARDVKVSGSVVIGSDGDLAVFTKKFKDPDMAVKTNFLMAEALFEMAKSHKAINEESKKELAKQEIARGKRVLEEALRDYPDTTLKAQGEFLLANLALQLDNYTEALSMFSTVISKYPESEYAPRSFFQKAVCYEKLALAEEKEAKAKNEVVRSNKGELACEEFVKLTYLYPNSTLAADAKLRLGNYYYKMERYNLSAPIFEKFAGNHPDHALAPKALLLAGYSAIKNEQARTKHAKETKTQYKEDYTQAIRIFSDLMNRYENDADIRPEAMYWLGDCLFKRGDQDGKVKCYQYFQRLTWDYPDTKWAKYARTRMAEQPIKKRR